MTARLTIPRLAQRRLGFGVLAVAPLSALLLAACSQSLSMPMPTLPVDTPEFPGSSTAVYTRIARGGNNCWFGPRGTLDRTYIWHARAEPEATGGLAEILIHEREDKNQRGLKTFAVTIVPRGGGAAVSVQNLKMPPAVGARMTEDAYRWARGGVGCIDGATSWAPLPPEPPAAKGKLKKPAAKPASTTAAPTSKAAAPPKQP